MTTKVMERSLTIFLFLVLIFHVSNGAQNVRYDGHKLIRVIPASNCTLTFLQQLSLASASLGLDFWSYPTALKHPVDIHVVPNYLNELSNVLQYQNITYRVLINDLQRLLQKEHFPSNAKSASQDFDSEYHSYPEILHEMRRLVYTTNHARLVSIGTSYEFRRIYAIEIFENESISRPLIFLNCGLHAREWLSPATCMYLVRQLLLDENALSLRANYTWIIVPVLNVDGYQYSFRRERFWRKNRSFGQRGCIGVDLNRNFNHQWGGFGTSADPCNQLYHGRHPFSETETYGLARYLLSRRNEVKVFLDIHSFGQLFMSPWGHTRKLSPHYKNIQEPMMKNVTDAIAAVHGRKFTYGPASVVIYPTTGDATDWTYARLGIIHSYSIELRPTFEDERGFIVPPEQIVDSGREILNGMMEMVRNLND